MMSTGAAPRVLVIAYDFPPHGAVGTMRTLRLVRELHRSGWDVRVLTSAPETFLPGTPVEPQLETLVPAGVTVIRAKAVRGLETVTSLARGSKKNAAGSKAERPAGVPKPAKKEPGLVWKAKDFVDALLSIPDNESGWMAPAIAAGLRDARKNGRPDVIYSSAPPWSGQVVALALHGVLRRPWVADFRDPWSRAPWREWRRAFRQRAAAFFERRVIGGAAAVLFVTRANQTEYTGVYGPEVARKFHLIPNGCDPSEIEQVAPMPPREEFVLLHAGTLYGARNPMPVIEAIARAVHRGALDRRTFRLRLLGSISLTTDLRAECARLGIADIVEFVSRVGRVDSLREMKSASALLLVQVGTTVSVPAKAYEYLAAGRPVLALTEEGETAELVRNSGVGEAVRPDAPIEEIERALLAVVALGSQPFAPSDPAHYDGRVHAATTGRLLLQLAGGGANPSLSAAVVRGSEPASSEGTRR